MMKIAVFDIDGTLSDNAHRQVHINEQNKDCFHEESIHDALFEEVAHLARHYYKHPDYKVVLITGRPSIYRSITMKWLTKNYIKYDNLYMNNTDDSDWVFKKLILDELNNDKDSVVIVFEDRQRCVDMWRDNGVLCMQCDYGQF